MEHISENITYIKKKDTKVGSQNLAAKFGFVPNCLWLNFISSVEITLLSSGWHIIAA